LKIFFDLGRNPAQAHDLSFLRRNHPAEREGSSQQGRIHSITCEVADPAGNRSSTSCVVVVPHDPGKK